MKLIYRESKSVGHPVVLVEAWEPDVEDTYYFPRLVKVQVSQFSDDEEPFVKWYTFASHELHGKNLTRRAIELFDAACEKIEKEFTNA